MSTDSDSAKASTQDGGSSTEQSTGAAASTTSSDVEVDLCAKFSAFCDTKTKSQFTSRACNKLVKDCFEEGYKFKKMVLSNRVDSSVFSKCKEKSKPFMVVNGDNCDKFMQLAAYEIAKLKTDNDKLDKKDALVDTIYKDLKTRVAVSKGPTIKKTKPSTTGNVAGLTDTSKYTGASKLRFDETGKGRGKEGRVDVPSKSGYVGNYKGEGTYEEETGQECKEEESK